MTNAKPNALQAWPELHARIIPGVIVFLDYDGTLTPIVPHPDLAVISESMRDTIRCIANRWPTAIVSGRALDQIMRLVDVSGIIYAGSHGFDIRGPELRHRVGQHAQDAIDSAFARIRDEVGDVTGILVENKAFSVAVHYRLVNPDSVADVIAATRKVATEFGLRVTGGKSVIEMRPDVDWDKGKAVEWLAARHPGTVPLFIGDDVTDEDAFRAIQKHGIGILVADVPRQTAASYSLGGVDEVAELLRRMCAISRHAGNPGAS